VTLYVRYLVLGPDPNEPITVRTFLGLRYGDDYVFGTGPNEFVLPRGGGIVESTTPLTLPKQAMPGTYRAEALVEDARGRFPQASGHGTLYIAASVSRHGGMAAAAR
jgi:hypothetical protein